jgi:hypothetical protein
MSKELNKRIADAFDKIYSKGDAGLDYMDGHVELDADLMQYFYDDAVETLSKADKTRLADMLELVAADMEIDLEVL